jgi:hypothetical protein
MAVAGLRGTGDWGADERPQDFRENILFHQPMGSSPIFALTSKSKKRIATDPQFHWWNESMDIVRLQVAGAISNTAQTLITVDSLDPTSSAAGRVYGTAGHLKEGDLLMVEPSADAAAFTGEQLEVVSVLSDGQFTVRRGAAGTTPDTIPNDAYLTLIGSVYAEGTASPQAVSRNPWKYTNYTQIFKDSYELTGTAEATKTRTGNPWSNDKKRKTFDHARGIEFAFLFGKPSETLGQNGKPKRTTAGLRQQIPAANTYVYSGGTTYFDLVDRISPVFDTETPAGDERIVMAGNAALIALNKIIASDENATIQWGGIVKAYGMNLRELILPQGRLLLRTHPLLSRHGLYSKSLWVLDFASITYVTLAGRDTKYKDDVQDKDEDIRRGFVQTECGIELDRGGLTCAYIGNINYVAAP